VITSDIVQFYYEKKKNRPKNNVHLENGANKKKNLIYLSVVLKDEV
jgi:hypothetical protein